MFLPRLDNNCSFFIVALFVNKRWTKTWLGLDFEVRAGPRLGPGPPTRPADSGTFCLGRILELFSASFSPHFQEIAKIMSTLLTRRNFGYFLEMPKISSGQRGRHYWRNFLEMRRTTCRKKFRNGAQKKVRESAGLVGGSWAKPWPSPDLKVGPKPSFGPALIFKSEQKHPKWSEMDPESTVRAENRST